MKKLKVYAIYGETENTLGRDFLAYSVGKYEKDAIKKAKRLNPKLEDSIVFSRNLSAVEVEVPGFRITAQRLERKVGYQ